MILEEFHQAINFKMVSPDPEQIYFNADALEKLAVKQGLRGPNMEVS